MTAKLCERAVLTTLRIGVWSGNKTDKEITNEINKKHNADRSAGRYNKQIVGRQFMKAITTEAASARAVHNLLTSPWGRDGTNIITNAMYQKYAEEMHLKRMGIEKAVNDFIGQNDQGLPQEEAKTRLGTMFDLADYPPTTEVKGKFTFDIEISAVPDSESLPKWMGLSEATIKKFKKEIEARTTEKLEAAMRSVYERIAEVLERMVERLRAEDANFRGSLVWNIEELAGVIPSLNIGDDKNLMKLAKEMKEQLCENSPELLRADSNLRRQTADKADALLKRIQCHLKA